MVHRLFWGGDNRTGAHVFELEGVHRAGIQQSVLAKQPTYWEGGRTKEGGLGVGLTKGWHCQLQLVRSGPVLGRQRLQQQHTAAAEAAAQLLVNLF